ncbi:hypothetical protein ACO0LO_05525 [Undibacterium sp. TJN25]|uniref:hypothetical protein n=1 Tax=Undibacterium sp. TJN25 TaxID=3413056 RepID=UPI003BEFA4F0
MGKDLWGGRIIVLSARKGFKPRNTLRAQFLACPPGSAYIAACLHAVCIILCLFQLRFPAAFITDSEFIMRFLRPLLVAGLLFSVLSACGKKEEKPPVNFLEGQQKSLQKARNVEQDVQKAADAQRQQIDKETGASKAAE